MSATGLVAAPVYEQRLSVCGGCEHHVEAGADVLHLVGKLVLRDTKMCDHCGCFMTLKARFAASRCPAGRWVQ